VSVTTLAPGAYHYRVRSRDASGNLALSVDINLIVPSPAPSGPPPVISYLSAWDITGSTATVTWSTDRPANTTVTYSTSPSLSQPQVYNDPTQVTRHQVNLTALANGATYYYVVSSTDAAGLKGSSPSLSFSTLDTAPPVISNVSAVITGPGTASVTWTTDKPTDSQVQYGPPPSYYFWSAWASTLTTQHQATLQWMPSGTNFFIVRAMDAGGLLTTTAPIAINVP
jgi:hypothetical protein